MNNRIVIIGAGGHGKVIADNALKNGYTDIYFLDDYVAGMCVGFPIIGTTADIQKLEDGKTDFVIAIGSNDVRKRIAEANDVNWVTLIHPSAQVGMRASIGKGTVVMAEAVINACAVIGEHCIVNTRAIVEHDNVIGNFVHISPGAALGGTVQVGSQTHIGIRAVVRNDVSICNMCTIGAGAVVVKNIDHCGVYVGVPAKRVS